MPRLSEATARARRVRILRAAFRCFARNGFSKTTMTDLYREAGVSAGSVYTWFRSKEELIEATYRENTTQVTAFIREVTQQREAPTGLAELVQTLAGWFERPEWREESRVNVQIWGEALTNARLRDAFVPAFATYRQILAEAIARAQARGVVAPQVEPRAVAQVVWGLLLGLEAQKAWEPELDAQAYAEAAAALLTGRFLPAPGAPERSAAMPEESKRIVREFLEEVFNQGQIAGARKYFADDYRHHSPIPGLPPGFAGFCVAHQQFREAFPDLRVTVEELIAEGGVVAGRTRWRGTHRGPFLGQPASGNVVEFELWEIWYLRDGKFVEHRALHDSAGLLQQLAADPAPSPTR